MAIIRVVKEVNIWGKARQTGWKMAQGNEPALGVQRKSNRLELS